MPSRNGFTLIELLVAIAIIAIISAIAIPQLFGGREKAKTASCDAMFTSLSGEIAENLEFVKGLTPRSTCNATTAAAVESCIVSKHSGEKNPRTEFNIGSQRLNAYVGGSTTGVVSCQVVIAAQSNGVAIVLSQQPAKVGPTRSLRISVD